MRLLTQAKIERRLAPFWKGLNDHSESWTEAQLVAAARGLPIPAADEVPPSMARTGSQQSASPRASDVNVNSLTVPMSSRSQSYESSTSANLSASHPAFSSSGPASPTTPSQSTAQLFRGRAKTLASLATGSKSSSPDLTPQEVRLPKDPNVNGQPVEAYLYKDASECPICFMYYPPYLNKTRCCDQPICSECFVQIKRPDPHPPEHEQPGQQRPPEEEAEQLVSEVAACPFCVTPEFGVTYDPPAFRRGLTYANPRNALSNPTSATSSSTSLAGGNRRRATSLSANSPQVITTDRVRPDWAKKLADARAHALRRSAAATALHNAAYVLGNQTDVSARGGLPTLGRRRRTLMFESPGGSGSATPGNGDRMVISPYGHVLRRRQEGGEDGGTDLYPDRTSSRRARVDDLEELMMMEAIRLSLAAEDDRKQKEEKAARKDAKKRAKEEKKEAKAAEKAAKKAGMGSTGQMYRSGTNDSSSTWASTSMARSSSNLGLQQSIPEEQIEGKGKAPAQPKQDFAGFNPLTDPSSTLNADLQDYEEAGPSAQGGADSAQRHLEESRANLQPSTSTPIPIPSRLDTHQRQISNASSVASSPGGDSSALPSNLPSAGASGVDLPTGGQDASQASGTPSGGGTNLEPMLNFRSLAAVIGEEDKGGHASEHIEHAAGESASSRAEADLKEPSPTGSPRLSPEPPNGEGNRSRGDSGESSNSAPPPIYVENPPPSTDGGDEITPAPRLVHDQMDAKDTARFDVVDHGHAHAHEATQ